MFLSFKQLLYAAHLKITFFSEQLPSNFRAATFAAVTVLPENDSPSPIISTLQLVDTR